MWSEATEHLVNMCEANARQLGRTVRWWVALSRLREGMARGVPGAAQAFRWGVFAFEDWVRLAYHTDGALGAYAAERTSYPGQGTNALLTRVNTEPPLAKTESHASVLETLDRG